MNSSKVIGIGGVVLLLLLVGGRWVTRQNPPKLSPRSENAKHEIPTENAVARGGAVTPESALLTRTLKGTATPSTQSVSALERLARVAASQPPRPQHRAKTSAAGKKPALAGSPVSSGKEPIQDPGAREALFYVGADPEAEEYWLDAINDPNLSAEERQDLIEDLNEDGLPDPRFPTSDDLPLILSRIELIEAVGPDAMDEVNADAFEEAYKDLVNLKDVAMGGGRPVN